MNPQATDGHLVEIRANDLAWILGEGEKTHTIDNGIPAGVRIIDAWCFENTVYLRLDQSIGE